eukprot:TRINITY_DN4551_c0_g1_i1.p1 TRINITY_DN4551_c0_g1~~TRINITY_DN4551_c0_g1_i1.p1  ORF type:complete len:420 (+),score=138.58 TRINITY_DN4551_c0_g1_i1:35-1261(+)
MSADDEGDGEETVTVRNAFSHELRGWLKEELLALLLRLSKSDNAEVYVDSIDSMFHVPDYKFKVKHKMDLKAMIKAAKDTYTSVMEPRADMALIALNARLYYGKASLYDDKAQALMKEANEQFDELQKEFEERGKNHAAQARTLKSTAEGRLKDHVLYNKLSKQYQEMINGDKGLNTTPVPGRESPAVSTPTPPTPNVTTANTYVAVPPPETPVITPPVKKRRVGFKIPTNVVSTPPDEMGYGALTTRMRDQLREDKAAMQQLWSSPADEVVLEGMKLNEDKWTVAAIVSTYLAKVDEREHLRDDEKASIRTVVEGVLRNFNTYATSSLLYPVERRAVESFVLTHEMPPEYTWAQFLGVRYLVRLLAILPSRLQEVTNVVEATNILRVVQGFVMYLDVNWDQFQGSGQ